MNALYSSPLLLLIALVALASATPAPKAIVLMVIDDWGWADSSINPDVNRPDIPMSNFENLVRRGVRLSGNYAQTVCSPTRSALMTARFPFRDGMQHETTIMPGSTAGIPATTPTLPELLTAHSPASNFTNVAVGKWHLGYASFRMTPTGRGFKRHVGYFQGQVDYYNKTVGRKGLVDGFDFWDDQEEYRDAVGNYSLPQYMAAVERFVVDWNTTRSASHNSNHRFFLYLSHQTVHVPLEAAGEDPKCGHIADYWRRVYCSMLVGLDQSVSKLVNLLESVVGEDWVMLSMADNGGMVRFQSQKVDHNKPVFPASAGDNHPLRGSKTTLFEGGLRSTSFLTGGSTMIPEAARGTTYSGLMHAVDVAATILALGGVNLSDLALSQSVPLDGLNIWDAIIGGKNMSIRDHVPLNIVNNGTSYSAVRFGDMKLILGLPCLANAGGAGAWFSGGLGEPVRPQPAHEGPYLFNITADPYELAAIDVNDPRYASIVKQGTDLIQSYVMSGDYSEPQPNRIHLAALPRFHGGAWRPWLK